MFPKHWDWGIYLVENLWFSRFRWLILTSRRRRRRWCSRRKKGYQKDFICEKIHSNPWRNVSFAFGLELHFFKFVPPTFFLFFILVTKRIDISCWKMVNSSQCNTSLKYTGFLWLFISLLFKKKKKKKKSNLMGSFYVYFVCYFQFPVMGLWWRLISLDLHKIRQDIVELFSLFSGGGK